MKNFTKFIAFLCLFYHSFLMAKLHAEPENKRLKITFVVDTYDQLKSGAVVSAYRFINILKQDHDINVITTGHSDPNATETGKDSTINRVKVRGFYIPFQKNKMIKNGMKFGWPDKKVLKDAFRNSDIVYVHFPFYLGKKAISYAKKMDKPVVVGFHIQPENLLFNIGVHSPTLIEYFYRFFVKRFYNEADYVICPSIFAENILTSRSDFKGKTKIISNGLSAEFRPTPSEIFPEYKDKFVILTVGRLAKEKRHDVIIDAISKSKYKDKIQLVITGDGDLKSSLEEYGKKLPNHPSIGYVSRDNLIRLYNTANLYIHASEIELEGMSVLEAIGSGLPALISDSNASASKQFALNQDFLFENANSDQLSAKIDYWVEHREELKEVGNQYAKSAEKYYIESSAKEMVKTFRKAIKMHQ